MARGWGSADSVHLLGFYPDIRACFTSSDFFVSPTYYDPCSLVVFEALACGLPVITTACNGAGELMTDGREGYVVTAPDALGELIAALDTWPTMTTGRRCRSMPAARPRAVVRPPRRAAGQGLRGSRRGEVATRAALGRTGPRRDDVRAKDPSMNHRGRSRGVNRHEGRHTRGRQGDAAPAVHPRLPQAADAAGRRRPDADHRGGAPPARAGGFRDVTVITGYLTELIEAFCGRARSSARRLDLPPRDDPARHRRRPDAGRPPRGAGARHQRRHPHDARLRRDVSRSTATAGAAATIASYPREVAIDFGVLEFGDDPHVLAGYREKPSFSFQVSMGVYILDPIAWDYLTPGEPLPMPDLLEAMRRAGRPVHCFRQPCYWLDIGRHDDYATANEIFVARRAEFLGEPDGSTRSTPSSPCKARTARRPVGPTPGPLPASAKGHRR